MRPISFLAYCSVTFLLLLVAYFCLVEAVVLQKPNVPASYRHFMLEASAPIRGKVIVESGSNSLHGLDVFKLSEYFDAPVLIVADQAGYPLRKKIFRLKRHLNRGDVLLLPLEWNYYSAEKGVPEGFSRRVANADRQLSHYVSELPLFEKMHFVFTEYPVRDVFNALFVVRSSDAVKQRLQWRLRSHEKKLRRRDIVSFGGTALEVPDKVDSPAVHPLSCDRYLFFNKSQKRMTVSETFRDDVRRLQALQRAGVSVYFIWPSVVDGQDSECYSDPDLADSFERYADAIRETLKLHGFSILGNFRDSQSTAECYLDTHYHVRASCSQQRTSTLLTQLREFGVPGLNTGMSQEDYVELILAQLASRRQDESDWQALGNGESDSRAQNM